MHITCTAVNQSLPLLAATTADPLASTIATSTTPSPVRSAWTALTIPTLLALLGRRASAAPVLHCTSNPEAKGEMTRAPRELVCDTKVLCVPLEDQAATTDPLAKQLPFALTGSALEPVHVVGVGNWD